MVILVTAKKNAGKTHYIQELAQELVDAGEKVKVLDGDIHRKRTGNHDYSHTGRIMNLQSAAEEAARYEAEGYIVLLGFVAPKKLWRNNMRTHWRESYLVYLPGGELWGPDRPGFIEYEMPDKTELQVYIDGQPPKEIII